MNNFQKSIDTPQNRAIVNNIMKTTILNSTALLVLICFMWTVVSYLDSSIMKRLALIQKNSDYDHQTFATTLWFLQATYSLLVGSALAVVVYFLIQTFRWFKNRKN